MCKLANYDSIYCTPIFISYTGEASILKVISTAASFVPIFCCDNGNLRCGRSKAMHESLCWLFVIVILACWIRNFHFLSKSHTNSFTLGWISLRFFIDWAWDWGLLKSLFSACWVSSIFTLGLSVQNLIYQLSALSYSVVTSCALFMLSSVIWCAIHTKSVTIQKFFMYSIPTPLNTIIFIVFAILNNGVGGEGEHGRGGVGVWGGGGSGGGVDGWGILAIPWLMRCSAFHGVLRMLPSSSLWELSWHRVIFRAWFFILNALPLHVLPRHNLLFAQ